MKPTPDMEKARQDIVSNSMPVPFAGCWIWELSVDRDGYGGKSYRIGGVKVDYRAHRLSYQAFNGPIPDGMMVCHRCDTPGCVNPDHLFLGTAKDNAEDRDRKGRTAKGGSGFCHKGHALSGYNLMKCGHCRKCNRIRSRNRYEKVRSGVRKNLTQSGVPGVYFTRGLWRVQISLKGKYHHLGSFEDFFEACAIRKSAEVKKSKGECFAPDSTTLHEVAP